MTTFGNKQTPPLTGFQPAQDRPSALSGPSLWSRRLSKAISPPTTIMTAVPQVLSDLVLRPGTVLISDELSAPADFLLHRFLHIRFKEKVSDCIFIAVTEDLARIRAVSSKAVGKNPPDYRDAIR